MAKTFPFAKISIWGRPIGVLADVGGRIIFEYEKSFIRDGLPISPVKLPLRGGAFEFPELKKSTVFQGLPGIFSDSLPDRYGHKVLSEYFQKQGLSAQDVPLFDKLLYIGARGMGAIEYAPAEKIPAAAGPRKAEDFDVTSLWLQSRKILEGKVIDGADQIYRYGGTAGGARAKAIIQYNSVSREFRSPFLPEIPGFSQWLIKFDGVDPEHVHLSSAAPWERIEFIYNRLAMKAGLNVPEVDYIEENGRFHFLVKRFDRAPGMKKIHMATMGGLLHLDLNEQRTAGYEALLKLTRTLTGDIRQMEEVFARAIFNVATQNTDDHVKNHSFLMDEKGWWSLSPVYDLVYTAASHPWFAGGQQLSVNGKYSEITRADFMEMGKNWGVPAPGAMIDRVLGAVSPEKFSEAAGEMGLTDRFPGAVLPVMDAMRKQQKRLIGSR